MADPPLLADVIAVLDGLYPPRLAAGWDAVGLVTGDPGAPVRRVLCAVDPTDEVVAEAVDWDADLLLTHHPLLLRGVHSVATTHPKGRTVTTLVRSDVALFVAHTNADAAAPGVSDALAGTVGLTDVRPLVPADGAGLDKVVVFVPREAAERVVDAMAAAGAGRLGDYERAAFLADGTGTFRPLPGAAPAVGSVGAVERVPETRVEMVCPPGRRTAVVAALRAAHPYEEPAFDVVPTASVERATGTGRVGRLAQAVPLRSFADVVARVLPETPSGVRVAGDLDAPVRTVAVCGGAGDDLFDTVRRAGADVYLTADLRHHPAGESLAHGAPALVEAAHWATEWPWLPDLRQRLLAGLAARGTTVEARVSTQVTDPWTLRLPTPSVTTAAPEEPR